MKISEVNEAVCLIKTAILRSQEKALISINQEQLSLYYGIGRYISRNTRSGVWGSDALETISRQLRAEMPGLRGFSATNLRLMRIFYEAWKGLEVKSSVATDEMQVVENQENIIRQLRLTNYEDFPITAFLNISFSHHSTILSGAKTAEERKYYIQLCYDRKLSVKEIQRFIAEDTFHNQGNMPNNFIMTFGRGFAYMGNQVHFDKLGHDHWVDLLFYNRILRSLVVVELKKGTFKPAYLGQLSHYLHVLDDDERLEGESEPVGIILCKDADKTFVEYVLQDYIRPMGVATYKTKKAKLMELLPAEEEMKKLL